MLKINRQLLISALLIMTVLGSKAAVVGFKNNSSKPYLTNEFPRKQILDNDSPIAFLKAFFKWYKTKYDYLDHHIFPVQMDLKKHTPYRINFKETERYLSILQSSGFFSDDYINYFRAYFKRIDFKLRITKQNDGTVDGLDFDLIMHNQEPESVLENLNNIKLRVISSTAKETIVKMQTPYSQDTYSLFHIKTINGKYLIDKIDFFEPYH